MVTMWHVKRPLKSLIRVPFSIHNHSVLQYIIQCQWLIEPLLMHELYTYSIFDAKIYSVICSEMLFQGIIMMVLITRYISIFIQCQYRTSSYTDWINSVIVPFIQRRPICRKNTSVCHWFKLFYCKYLTSPIVTCPKKSVLLKTKPLSLCYFDFTPNYWLK